MDNIKANCVNCNGTEFYVQDGLYFCEECDFQCVNLVETEYDNNFNAEATHRVRFTRKPNNTLQSK